MFEPLLTWIAAIWNLNLARSRQFGSDAQPEAKTSLIDWDLRGVETRGTHYANDRNDENGVCSEASCKKQLKEVLSLEETIGGGSAFTPGRVWGEPAFVVGSRFGVRTHHSGVQGTEWWSWEPQQLGVYRKSRAQRGPGLCGQRH